MKYFWAALSDWQVRFCCNIHTLLLTDDVDLHLSRYTFTS
jgi:hypothetical protein